MSLPPPFPQPLRVNGLKFYRRSELDHFKICLEAQALGRPFPPKPPIPDGDALLSHRKVALEFSTSTRTIDRWSHGAVAATAEAAAKAEAVEPKAAPAKRPAPVKRPRVTTLEAVE